jgi:hypothetical protein
MAKKVAFVIKLSLGMLICIATSVMHVERGAAALIGVDFDNPGGSVPTNWNQYGGFGIPALASNLRDETGVTTVVDLAITRAGFQVGTTGTAANAGTVPTHTQSLTGLGGLTFARGSSPPSSMSFQWQSLIAGQVYDVWVFGLTDATSAARNRISITGSGAPVSFDQSLTTGNLWVNGQVGSGSSLTSFAVPITANTSGQIIIQVTPVSTGGAVGIAALGLREKLPVPGDFNSDTLVDSGDLAKWRGSFRQTGDSDADADGDSDGADFLIWQRQLGSSSALVLAVPEASGALLAALALLGTVTRWRHCLTNRHCGGRIWRTRLP